MEKEDVFHIYKGILLSHKENKTLPFAAPRMDLRLSYWVKPVKDK